MTVCVLALTMLTTVSTTAVQLNGAFTLRANDRNDRVNVNFQYTEGRSNYGRDFERSAFTDVSRSGDRITFKLRRAAGVITFEGRGSLDRASGWYDFSPSGDYRREIERLGFREVDDRALFAFALDDLGIAQVRQLQGLVADTLDTTQLVRLINHGAGVRYVQAMTDAGFRKLSSDEYRRARDHGVSVEYVRAMRAAGIDVGHDEFVRARDHGVSAEFIRRMSALGYGGLDLSEYVRFRDHGVAPEFVEEIRGAGLVKLTPRELVRLRDHGVSASDVRRAKDRYKDMPTVDEIIRLHNRGALGR